MPCAASSPRCLAVEAVRTAAQTRYHDILALMDETPNCEPKKLFLLPPSSFLELLLSYMLNDESLLPRRMQPCGQKQEG